MRLGLAFVMILAVPAAAAPKLVAKPAPHVWLGVFDPKLPAHQPWANDKLTPMPHAGVVHVFADGDGNVASGDVVIVHPLLGKIATGHVDTAMAPIADFAIDQRDGDDGVLVLPAGTTAAIVDASKADVAAIRQVLLKNESLAGVKRALVGLEVAAIDIDGDGKPDLAATYGCNGWADGSCQSKGQFFLAKRGARWVELE